MTPLPVCIVLILLYCVQSYFFVTRVIFSRSEAYYKSRKDKYVKVKKTHQDKAEENEETGAKAKGLVQRFKSELALFLRGSETNRILLRCLTITIVCRMLQFFSDAIGILDSNGGLYAFVESLPLVLSQIMIYTII